MTDLQGLGRTLGSLAGDVDHDTQLIGASWPKGRTGQLAAADAARIGGALEECHQVLVNAERAAAGDFSHPVLGARCG